jgi:hypothetical protein
MARYAIRDQEALLDALTPRFGEPDADTAEAIAYAKALIADFRKLRDTLPAITK